MLHLLKPNSCRNAQLTRVGDRPPFPGLEHFPALRMHQPLTLAWELSYLRWVYGWMQGAVVPEAAQSSVPVTSASGDASDSTACTVLLSPKPQDIPCHNCWTLRQDTSRSSCWLFWRRGSTASVWTGREGHMSWGGPVTSSVCACVSVCTLHLPLFPTPSSPGAAAVVLRCLSHSMLWDSAAKPPL